MRISVTQLDINRGVQSKAEDCPVARALVRAVNWHKKVSVGISNADLVSASGQEVTVALPTKASDFIRNFDTFGPAAVEPFTFQIVRPAAFKRGRPAA